MQKTPLYRLAVTAAAAVFLVAGVGLTSVSPAFAEDSETPSPTPTAVETPRPAPTDSTPTPQPGEGVVTPTSTPAPSSTPTSTPSSTPTAVTVVPTPTPATPSAEPDVEPAPDSEVAPLAFQADGLQFSAASISGFDPGNIISDYNFYNSWAMTENEIQSFLDSKIGTCKNSNCLNVYRMDTPTRTFDFGTCATYQGAPNESAARIIYKAQRACGISAKVILVTLQKEQGLATNDSPPLSDLRKAMGFGCPDTSECDANFYGFFNQVYAAARQLTWYNNPEGSFTKRYKVGASNPVQYNPNVGCGAPEVYIQNKATAALYYYTPYQPNAAALANLGGTGDACSSYGNRNFWDYYRSWFGNPIAAERLAGADRFDTAVEISKSTFPSSNVNVVYVTTGSDFPDALSAAPAAAAGGGPLLLTTPTKLPASVKAEIARLKPKKIVIVGGKSAVSASVEKDLASLTGSLVRLAGKDRYETSRIIAKSAFPDAAGAYVATGANFPDALSAGAAAGIAKFPVVLVNGSAASVDQPTKQALAGKSKVMIAGGAAAVSAKVEAGLAAEGRQITRFAGADRNQTSYLINKATFTSAKSVYLATGWSFPDALAGAAAAATTKSPLYVVPAYCVPADTRSAINITLKANRVILLGGPAALFDQVAALAPC
ncbi:hypothetical protein GCM10022381_16510 [Leifsonia kafniensis]|uniref:Cell wall-binding repeat-containing protein n=1 Tax=Leifsonia kafniensis TaxID=475957 RepID=A0ABP7KE50_9MICO